MRFPYSLSIAVSLLLAGAGLVACDENEPDQPVPVVKVEKAVLSGSIQPADAVTVVTATDKSGKTMTVTPNSAGKYAFPEALPGAYTLRFSTTPTYTAPADYFATLSKGGTFVATTVELAPASAIIDIDGVRVPNKITVEHMWFSTIGNDGYTFYLAKSSYLGNQYPLIRFFLNYASNRRKGPDVGYVLPLGVDEYFVMYEDDIQTPLYAGDWYPSRTGGTLTTTSVDTAKHLFSGSFDVKVGSYVDGDKRQNYVIKTLKGTFTNLPYETYRR